jgi:hypothetical protein
MQKRITDQIVIALRLRELEPTQSLAYSNRGTIYGMDEDNDSIVIVDFDFQPGKATITVDRNDEEPVTFRFAYSEGEAIRELVRWVRREAQI